MQVLCKYDLVGRRREFGGMDLNLRFITYFYLKCVILVTRLFD